MIQGATKARAKRIGDDSYGLINFDSLPNNASIREQIEALREDQKWQEDHMNEISRTIDRLIRDLESGNEASDE